MPFKKGVVSNPKGRGSSMNKSKLLMIELARTIVTDPKVQSKLLEQARAGTLHPVVMRELFHYHGGRPPVRVEVAPASVRSDELVESFRLLPKSDRLALAEIGRKVRRLAIESGGRVIDVTPAPAPLPPKDSATR